MPTEPPDGEKIAGIDPDDIAIDVKTRASGIALVDWRINLNEIVIGVSVEATAERRDNAGGDSAAEAIGIPDRDYPVADPWLVIGKSNVGKIVASIHLEQSQIGSQISAHYLGRICSAIFGGYYERHPVLNDVIIRHCIPIRGNKKA